MKRDDLLIILNFVLITILVLAGAFIILGFVSVADVRIIEIAAQKIFVRGNLAVVPESVLISDKISFGVINYGRKVGGIIFVLEDFDGKKVEIEKYNGTEIEANGFLEVEVGGEERSLIGNLKRIWVYVSDGNRKNPASVYEVQSAVAGGFGGGGSSGGGGSGTTPQTPEPPPAPKVVKAFPEAEGFGAYAVGGRGGQIVYVTTLEDYYHEPPIEGSLRWAIEELTGPRIIMFKVGGVIDLKWDININQPYITIAGQTAPEPGITIAHYRMVISNGAHDVVVRYLRFRVYFDTEKDSEHSDNMDGITVVGSNVNAPVTNVIIDHCSVAWGIDEGINTWNYVDNFTMQWSIIAEASTFGHKKGYHSMGYLGGGIESYDFTRASIHHNLFAHNGARNPKLDEGKVYDVRNNIFYNWFNNQASSVTVSRRTGSEPKPMLVNFVNNFYIDGKDVSDVTEGVISVERMTTPVVKPKIYLGGNIAPLRVSDAQDEWDIGVWWYDGIYHDADFEVYGLSSATNAAPVETDEILEMKNKVLSDVGMNYPVRDLLDERIVDELNYVLENYHSVDNLLEISVPRNINDVKLGQVGPNVGDKSQVLELLILDSSIDSEGKIYPLQYRMLAGQTMEQAKVAMLDAMVVKKKITETQKNEILSADASRVQWTQVERTIPSFDTVIEITPTLTGNIVIDSDNDGMPDSWESAHGFNPQDGSDGKLDFDGDGYTNVEEYLNELPF